MTLFEKYFITFETVKLFHNQGIVIHYLSDLPDSNEYSLSSLEVNNFLETYIVPAIESQIVNYLKFDMKKIFLNSFSVSFKLTSKLTAIFDGKIVFRFSSSKDYDYIYSSLKYWAQKNHYLSTEKKSNQITFTVTF